MNDEELARRKPVWIAMSELFLDTEVSGNYQSIAETLAASPYSLEQLRRILDDEVTPVLQWNLLAAAGEWAMFPEHWVVEQISRRAEKRRWLPNLVHLDQEWAAIEAAIVRLRPESAPTVSGPPSP